MPRGSAIAVSDTGIGIPEHLQAGLFTPYAQADPSIRRLYGGSGLGLTICKRLAGLMGGEVRLHSREGEGTRFEVEVVLREGGSRGRRSAGRRPAGIAGLRLLIVDPNPDHAGHDLAADAELGGRGAGRRPRAPRRSRRSPRRDGAGRPVRVALVDRSLPDMSGEELGRRIKADAAARRDRARDGRLLGPARRCRPRRQDRLCRLPAQAA